MVHRGTERIRSFADAVRTESRYVAGASYGRQLAQFLEYYPAKAILVISSQELLERRKNAMQRILTHIGVDPELLPPNLDAMENTAEDKLAIPPILEAPRFLWRSAKAVTSKVPRSWRDALRRSLGSPLPKTLSSVDDETVAWIREQLAADAQLLETLTAGALSDWTLHWSTFPGRADG